MAGVATAAHVCLPACPHINGLIFFWSFSGFPDACPHDIGYLGHVMSSTGVFFSNTPPFLKRSNFLQPLEMSSRNSYYIHATVVY
jgi:hypothetical protein